MLFTFRNKVWVFCNGAWMRHVFRWCPVHLILPRFLGGCYSGCQNTCAPSYPAPCSRTPFSLRVTLSAQLLPSHLAAFFCNSGVYGKWSFRAFQLLHSRPLYSTQQRDFKTLIFLLMEHFPHSSVSESHPEDKIGLKWLSWIKFLFSMQRILTQRTHKVRVSVDSSGLFMQRQEYKSWTLIFIF